MHTHCVLRDVSRAITNKQTKNCETQKQRKSCRSIYQEKTDCRMDRGRKNWKTSKANFEQNCMETSE